MAPGDPDPGTPEHVRMVLDRALYPNGFGLVGSVGWLHRGYGPMSDLIKISIDKHGRMNSECIGALRAWGYEIDSIVSGGCWVEYTGGE